MPRRKNRPADPAESARKAYEQRRNPQAWGPNEDALKLRQNADIRSEAETRTKTRRIQRFDVFATIKLDDAAFTAVRRYQADLATSFGTGDKPHTSSGEGSAELVNGAMMAASDRCAYVRSHIGPHDALLLDALSLPTHVQGQPCNWHATVRQYRGLIDRDSQSKAVRQLSESVRLAWVDHDNGEVRKAA